MAGKELTPEEARSLLDELVVTSGQLATVVDNFAVTLSKEFEDGVRTQVDAVRAVLARCPQPTGVWDGQLHEEHLTIELFVPEARRVHGAGAEAVGVKITHDITGINRTSDSKPTRAENEEVARRSLKRAVAERWAEMNR